MKVNIINGFSRAFLSIRENQFNQNGAQTRKVISSYQAKQTGNSFVNLFTKPDNMKIIAEVPHPDFKITFFNWNNRYLIKLEAGHLEQTYKVDQFDLAEKMLNKLLDEQFLNEAADRFASMDRSLQAALYRLENQPD